MSQVEEVGEERKHLQVRVRGKGEERAATSQRCKEMKRERCKERRRVMQQRKGGRRARRKEKLEKSLKCLTEREKREKREKEREASDSWRFLHKISFVFFHLCISNHVYPNMEFIPTALKFFLPFFFFLFPSIPLSTSSNFNFFSKVALLDMD